MEESSNNNNQMLPPAHIQAGSLNNMEESSNDNNMEESNNNNDPPRYIRSTTARFNANECRYILKAFKIALETVGSYQDFGNPVIIRRIESRLLHRIESDKLNRENNINNNPQLNLPLEDNNGQTQE